MKTGKILKYRNIRPTIAFDATLDLNFIWKIILFTVDSFFQTSSIAHLRTMHPQNSSVAIEICFQRPLHDLFSFLDSWNSLRDRNELISLNFSNSCVHSEMNMCLCACTLTVFVSYSLIFGVLSLVLFHFLPLSRPTVYCTWIKPKDLGRRFALNIERKPPEWKSLTFNIYLGT